MSTDKQIRVVRGWTDNSLHEAYVGAVYLAFPWPEDCPISPEEYVRLNRCKREELQVIGLPMRCSGGWNVPVYLSVGYVAYRSLSSLSYVPDEPERCEHVGYRHRRHSETATFERCCHCGAILSDRRTGQERRNGERRTNDHIYGGGRRRPSTAVSRHKG
ncbi:MAG: hypothetical protein NUW01_13430, partial [Gemmatimonadaceae bacterium]|nr:hypothetical protein [Gemmatimonadaceae bacterium]